MKTIMYISESTESSDVNGLPQSMASVIVTGRRRNRDNNIRALLCCHRGYYLQVLEGENRDVDKLFASIQKDFRHKDIKVLVDSPCSKPYLDNLPFKLATMYQPLEQFTQYVNNYLLQSYPLNTNVGVIFKELRTNQKKFAFRSGDAQHGFNGRKLSLTQWPKFDIITPTRELLELCAVLTRAATSYEVLSTNNPYPSEFELNEALNSLQSMSLLEMEYDASAQIASHSGGAFFSKMKGFIGRLRA